MELKYLRGKVEVKKADGLVTVILSDETLDRHGDVLPIDQWDLTKFMLSPRMLVDHNHEVGSIVGRWENTRIENNKLIADAKFHDYTEIAKAVSQMVATDFLDTVSVGFIPHAPKEDGGRDSFELIEASWVTVPANPSARILKGLMEKETPKDQVAQVEVFLKEEEVEEPEKSEEDVVDMTPGAMEAMGWKIVKSLEDFQTFLKAEGEHVNSICLCETQFIEKLIAEHEKLLTLMSDLETKVEASKELRRQKAFIKEVVGQLSDSLRKLNQRS